MGSRLVELDLSANRIGDEGLLALATALGGNEFLEVLRLARNRIGDKRMGALARAVECHRALRCLDLSCNTIRFVIDCP